MAAAPTIVVAGGGPAGLLSAILLGRKGYAVTVFETDELERDNNDAERHCSSPKSYQISLNERGLGALSFAGLGGLVRDAAIERTAVVIHDEAADAVSGSNPRTVPVGPPPALSIGRSFLVRCLTEALLDEGRAAIRHGLSVTDVRRAEEEEEERDGGRGSLTVCLSDGSTVHATHVIGADGKWSPVRDAAIRMEQEERGGSGDGHHTPIRCTLQNGEAWGVVMAHTLPPGFRTDATHVLRPRTLGVAMYALLAPLKAPSGEANLVLVLYDDVLKAHPWLAPRAEEAGAHGDDASSTWEEGLATDDSGRNNDFDAKLFQLLRSEFPRTLGSVGATASRSVASGAYVRRRATWFELDRFSALNGQVVLVGDAAHSMSASLGEGCNTALSSAVALVEEVEACVGRDRDGCDAVSAAFERYGAHRPAAVHDIQRRSGEASRSKPR